MNRISILFLCSLVIFSNVTFGQGKISELIIKADTLYDSNPSESFSIISQAEEEAIKLNHHEFDGDIHEIKGRYYLLITKYDLATIELNKAESFFKKKKNKSSLTSTYSLKSILHSRIGEPNKSHQLLLQVLSLNKELKDTSNIIGNLLNISLDYIPKNDLDSMRIMLTDLNNYKSKFRDFDFYYYYQNWGTYNLNIGKIKLAIEQYKKAKEVANQLNKIDSQATINVLLAESYRLSGNLKQAKYFANQSYNISKQNKLIYELNDALDELILITELQKDYTTAFNFQKEKMEVENEIFNLEKIQKVKIIEGQLEVAEKEKQITEAEAKLKSEKLENAKAKARAFWMYAIIVFVLILLFFIIFIYLKTKKLNTTIQQQKKEVEIKSNSLEYALKNINDSIEYSKRIQNAILPPLRLVKEYLKDSFIFYQPKDIVAGDFYWMEHKDNKILFAAADCTGHGVPGAMVSVVCNNALNRSVREYGLTDPAEILNKSREIVIQEFEKSDEEVKDGMDIALCVIDGVKLHYAGAHNPLWIVRDKKLIEIKADKQPIGKFFNQMPFTSHTINLKKNDVIYLFSDGFADQFGGENGKKYKVKAFKELILKIHHYPMDKQKDLINLEFESWKGDLEQLDDVCIIGVRL